MHDISFLLEHASTQPESVAMRCTQRTTTYRKLASRIERATARLQGEWKIRPGDMAAYCGSGHQDAVVLYFALLRCGADLLVVPASADSLAPLLSRYGASLLLNDNGDPITGAPRDMQTFPLHTIIATPCAHQVASAPGHVGNRLVRAKPGSDAEGMNVQSSDALFACVRPRCDTVRVDAHRLFEESVFAPVVLSILAGGGMLHID